MKTLHLGALATALLLTGPAVAQVFDPQPVADGWSSRDFGSSDTDGTLRVTWNVTTGLGNLTIVCGAWAVDEPDLAKFAPATLAKSSASEEGRPLLSSLSFFTQAASLDALVGTPATCVQTTAVSTSNVAVTIYEGEVQIKVPASDSD